MSMPDSYLTYPARRRGMDNPYYDWTPLPHRTRRQLDGGVKAMATIIVPIEFFPLNPPAVPFRHPGAMKTTYPDLRHYTVRDYGNRVGVFRLLRVFAELGVAATFAVDAESAKRYPPLLEAIRTAGHEIAAHGLSTAHIHHDGLSSEEEAGMIKAVRQALPEATTWMSPVRNQSTRTMALLADAGFERCLDWEPDMRPLAFKVPTGRMVALPHYNELNDVSLLVDRRQSDEEWVRQILHAAEDHVRRHNDEGAGGFAFTLTPYIVGQPYRQPAVRQIVAGLASMVGLRVVTAADMHAAFTEISP